jgi:hypothetical protein
MLMLNFRLASQPSAHRVALSKETYDRVLCRRDDLPRDPGSVELFLGNRLLDDDEKLEVLEERTFHGQQLFD